MLTKIKTKKSSLGKKLVVLFMIILIVGIYYVTRISDNNKFTFMKGEEETEFQNLIEKDIDGNYPASPKEVVKLYQRISKALYTEELNDDEINKLTAELRKLLDDELLQSNTLENHLINLKTELASYREGKKTINNYVVKTDNIEEWEKNGEKYCSLVVTLGVKEDSVTDIIPQRYVLRLDDEENWKILGFDRVDSEESKK